MHDKQRKTIEERIRRNKEKLLETLQRTPVTQVACERAGVSRATFFRWRNEDEKFAEKVNEALSDGKGLISDMAISQLIHSIQDKNLGAIKYWLSSHHQDYANKLSITAEIKHEDIKLTPEQETIVRRALELASLPILTNNKYEPNKPRDTKNHRANDQGRENSQSDNNAKS